VAAGKPADRGGAGAGGAIGTLRQAGAIEESFFSVDAGAVGIRAAELGWQVLAWAPNGTPLPGGLPATRWSSAAER